MNEIPLKSFLGQNSSFLRGSSALLIEDIENILDEFEFVHLDSDDRKIIEKIIFEIKSTKSFPIWWSEQESTYLSKISNKEKSIHYIIFRYKFRNFPSKRIVTEFPLYVLLEPVSACNLRCPFCFQVDPDFTRKPYAGIMDMTLFKRVIDECEENGTGAITLASRGEPTLHPKFSEMLEYLAGK